MNLQGNINSLFSQVGSLKKLGDIAAKPTTATPDNFEPEKVMKDLSTVGNRSYNQKKTFGDYKAKKKGV